jgi:RNA polymerase sigma-70 factor (ECF subfamily)
MNESLPHESVPYPMKFRTSDSGASKATSSEGITSSFENLFHEHWTSVYNLLVRLVVDPAEAEDLALETFLRLFQRHPDAERDFNVGGWLYKVAVNLGLHSIRSFKRRERYELTAGKYALEEGPETHPAEILAGEEDRRLVRAALAQINQRQAEILILRHSGLNYKDIASKLGLSPTSIGPLLLRAEREFEKQYRSLTQEEEA